MLELQVAGANHVLCGILCPGLGAPVKGVLLAWTIAIEGYWDGGGTEIMEACCARGDLGPREHCAHPPCGRPWE